MRLDVGRCGGCGAVVAERLLAVGKVEPDRRPPVAIGEADAGLAERRALGRDEAAAAREDGGRRAAIGAERPGVRLHAREVDAARREARVEDIRRSGPVLAVEDAGNEPAG